MRLEDHDQGLRRETLAGRPQRSGYLRGVVGVIIYNRYVPYAAFDLETPPRPSKLAQATRGFLHLYPNLHARCERRERIESIVHTRYRQRYASHFFLIIDSGIVATAPRVRLDLHSAPQSILT